MPVGHIVINVDNIDKAREFYLAALKPLGYKIHMNFFEGKVLGLGAFYGPDFWLSAIDAPTANGSDMRHHYLGTDKAVPQEPRELTGKMHIAFTASNREQVHQFHKAALAAGAKCNGKPGLRTEYFLTYYGAFVLDPEGRNIEAYCMKPGFWAEPWGLGVVGWSLTLGVVAGIAGSVGKYMGWF